MYWMRDKVDLTIAVTPTQSSAEMFRTMMPASCVHDQGFETLELSGCSGLEGAILDQAVMTNAYLSKTIADVKSAKGADFSEAVLPPYAQKSLCASGIGGTNEKTGVATRDSLMCPD